MDETLRQLGGLLLGSVPTIILLVVVFGLYTSLVHKPLVRVLAERRSKTQGAIEKAHADIAAAEARTAEYERRLREARVALFKAQETRRQEALKGRSALVAAARVRAQEQIDAARSGIAKDSELAQASLQAEANSLAQDIVRTILQTVASQRRVRGTP